MKIIRNYIILLIVLLFFIIVVPATSAKIVTNTASTVFIGEQDIINKTAPVTPNKDPRIPIIFPDPNSIPYVPMGNQFYITDFPQFLAEWNEKMHWGYSPQQIENYSRMLEDGVLKKYKKFPDYPTLDIPDMKSFCLEVGDAMGLSNKQSEAFAIVADDELRRAKIEFNKPLFLEPESKSLTEASTQSAPFAIGRIDYEYIFVDFTIPSPVPPGYPYSWNSIDITDARNDLYYGTNAISNQAPQQASMSNTGGFRSVLVTGVNPGRVEESMAPNGWMENAIRNLGYTDANTDGRVSDDFARYWKTAESADAVVIVYCTHDAMGAYAAGPSKGYADKAVISYWGWDEGFFDAVPGSYEHEIVHLFGALDEFNESSYCGEYSWFAVSPMKEMYKNTNHHRCTPHTDSSVMNYPYTFSIISQSSQKFIGWGDYDNDGILDPLDNAPWGNREKIGVFRNGAWNLDLNGNGTWDTGIDKEYSFGSTGWTPIVGDWNYDGKTKIGIYKEGSWYLDMNNNGIFDSGVDKQYSFGTVGWTPVLGDWNGDRITKIGIYQNGVWYLDWNGNGAWDALIDKVYNFGATGWTPVLGDWNQDGKTEIGIYQNGVWYLDWNGNGAWDAGTDKIYNFGTTGWTPIVGDWNHDGKTEIGIYQNGVWYLDWNGNGAWDALIDKVYNFGATEWTPVLGDWNQNGISKIGVYQNGVWYLDWNGNGAWDALIDKVYNFGANGWTPIVGKWN